jgi:hypothetical protein
MLGFGVPRLAAGSRGAALSETAAVAPKDTWFIAATAPIAESAFASGTGRYPNLHENYF